MRPGHAPEEVLDAAVAACVASGHTVEARDIEVIAGRARIWVRFTVAETSDDDENLEASEVCDDVTEGVRAVAFGGVAQCYRRVGGRWTRVPRVVPPA